MGSQTSSHSLINHLDLTVKFLTVLVPVPILGLPFVLHLVDCLAGKVAFLSSSVDADKLSLASKKCFATTVVLGTLLGDKMTLSRGILEGHTCKLKDNLIITAKCVSPFTGLVTRLPLGQGGWIFGPDNVFVSFGDNVGKTLTVVVGLVNLNEIREALYTMRLRFFSCMVLQGMCSSFGRTM